ncbi:MAG: hypothetical protein ACYDBJ_18040 [Aggregatilineales bacterium]
MATRNYALYLNDKDPDDVRLIAYLDRFVPTRRVGSVLRAALLTYTAQGAPGAHFAPQRPVTPPPDSPTGYLERASASSGQAMDKLKRTFIK